MCLFSSGAYAYIFDPNVHMNDVILTQCELCEKTLCTSLQETVV